MTLAVLYASPGNFLDPADDLTAALHAAGAFPVDRPTGGSDPTARLGEIARRARDRDEPVPLRADNLVAHPSLLWTPTTEPAGRGTALVAAPAAGPRPQAATGAWLTAASTKVPSDPGGRS